MRLLMAISDRRRNFALLCLLFSLISSTSPLDAFQSHGAPYGKIATVSEEFEKAANTSRALVEAFMSARGVPGLAAAVAVDGQIVWSEGFGYANVEHRIPVTTLT